MHGESDSGLVVALLQANVGPVALIGLPLGLGKELLGGFIVRSPGAEHT